LQQTQELELTKVATDSKKTVRIDFLKFSQALDSEAKEYQACPCKNRTVEFNSYVLKY
jgi:hypothetical protein